MHPSVGVSEKVKDGLVSVSSVTVGVPVEMGVKSSPHDKCSDGTLPTKLGGIVSRINDKTYFVFNVLIHAMLRHNLIQWLKMDYK